MSFTMSDLIVETLKRAGVGRVDGLTGDPLNGFTDALRRNDTMVWEQVRPEEAAAFAAASDAAVTGERLGGEWEGYTVVTRASSRPGRSQARTDDPTRARACDG